jgi:hypothetical protein
MREEVVQEVRKINNCREVIGGRRVKWRRMGFK